SNWPFDDKLLIQSLYKVSKTTPIVPYLRDAERLLLRSQRIYNLFHKMLKKLSGSVLILGSQIVDQDSDYREVDENLAALFPYSIPISPPEDENHLVSWKSQMEEGMKKTQAQDNGNHVMVLSTNDLDCDDLDSICMADTMALSNYIEEIVFSTISYHLMKNKDPEYRNGKLVISSNSLPHGLSIFQQGKSVCKDTLKLEAQVENPKEREEVAGVNPRSIAGILISESKSEAETIASTTKTEGDNSTPAPQLPASEAYNEFEKRIRPEVIPANEINVTFADVVALDEIKESLQELVMLPLRRPNLFKGGVLKPCRGILLFGPPGTGKTMMAKAIAKESRASFIRKSNETDKLKSSILCKVIVKGPFRKSKINTLLPFLKIQWS
ncbi:LOW QUALITY PROTEIN: AAA domain-containing protein, partial [Cephalotus follicularis]